MHLDSVHSSSSMFNLVNNLQKMEEFLPAPAVTNFNPSQVVLQITLSTPSGSSLNFLFDTVASAFWCEREVQALFVDIKGNFIRDPLPYSNPLPGPLDRAIESCNRMIQLILEKAPEVINRNLVRVWEKLTFQYPEVFPSDIKEAKEIEAWFQDSENQKLMENVKDLDFTRSDIEILPPILMKIPNIRRIYLYDSPMGAFPELFSKQQSIEILMESQRFYEGPYLLYLE